MTQAETNGSLEALRERLNALPLCSALGLRCTGLGDGVADVALDVAPELRHTGGGVPGVFLLAMADVAASFALHTVIPYTDQHVTIDLSMHFMRPLTTAGAQARGRVVRVGGKVAFARAEITDDDGAVCATASGSWAVRRDSSIALARDLAKERR